MARDNWRLAYHLMPPDGWLNDPNGLCQVNGRYHIYFQYAPNTPGPDGKKHRTWGHYAGPDLIHLEFEGVPFWPEEPDRDGCYSGSAFIHENEIWLYYTGNIKLAGDYDYIHDGRESNTILVRTKDGKTYSGKQVLFGTKDYPADCTRHVRDPKVWEQDGIYYMVQGARMNDDSGSVLLYESEDLFEWKLVKIIATEEPFGYMWECPDYFELDGEQVLSICPQGMEAEEFRYQNNHQAGYFFMQGDLRSEQTFSAFREWDYGHDFYAPQSFVDEQGRRLFIGWAGLPDKPYGNPTSERGWENCLTVPRVLHVKNGVVTQMPVEELKSLRFDGQKIAPDGTLVLPDAAGDVEIRFAGDSQCYDTGAVETAADGRWKEPAGAEASAEKIPDDSWRITIGDDVYLTFSDGILELNMTEAAGCGRDARRVKADQIRDMRLMIDRSMLEIYCNDGAIVFASRFYPDDPADRKGRELDVKFNCPGAQITAWQMHALPVNETY